MDDANNLAGEQCATDEGNCEDLCLRKLNAGGLSGPGGSPLIPPFR